jgi:hypothetical protein
MRSRKLDWPNGRSVSRMAEGPIVIAIGIARQSGFFLKMF